MASHCEKFIPMFCDECKSYEERVRHELYTLGEDCTSIVVSYLMDALVKHNSPLGYGGIIYSCYTVYVHYHFQHEIMSNMFMNPMKLALYSQWYHCDGTPVNEVCAQEGEPLLFLDLDEGTFGYMESLEYHS